MLRCWLTVCKSCALAGVRACWHGRARGCFHGRRAPAQHIPSHFLGRRPPVPAPWPRHGGVLRARSSRVRRPDPRARSRSPHWGWALSCHGRAPTGRAPRPSSGGRCRRCPPRRSFDAQRLAQLLILAVALSFLPPFNPLVAPLPPSLFRPAPVGPPVPHLKYL